MTGGSNLAARALGRLARRSATPEAGPSTPCLPEGLRVYAIGDVHGRADLLSEMFDRIDRHAARAPIARSIDVLVGDYVDRGPDSRGVIDLILARQAHREVVALAGNHEEMLLRFLLDPHRLAHWLPNGGFETLASYGIDLAGAPAPLALDEIRVAALRAIPASHLRFLSGLGEWLWLGDYFFTHAGVRPGVPLRAQQRDDLLWIREEFLGSRADFGAVVVHGHTPSAAPEIKPNRIAIDTGAYLTGRLTCLVLEGTSAIFL